MVSGEEDRTRLPFVWRALTAVLLVVLAAVALLAFWTAAQVLLLFFGALLLSIVFRAFSGGLCKYTRLSQGLSLAVVIVTLVVGIGLAAWFLAPQVVEQFEQFMQQLPQAVRQIEEFLERRGLAPRILTGPNGLAAWLEEPEELARGASTAVSWILQGISALLIMFFVAVYFSIEPGLYTSALVRLTPPARRDRVRQIIDELAHTLRWWLLTRLVSMAAVGFLTTMALWLLGVPLAILLGLQAFALTFVPYVGPIVATIPIALVALAEGPTTLLWALALYTVIQSIEGFAIMPLAQQRFVHLPPAATLISEVLMGVWFGPLGVVFATPLAAGLLPVAKRLYIEDTLGASAEDASEDEE
jgi:predicted PurR-regulated permease PerM